MASTRKLVNKYYTLFHLKCFNNDMTDLEIFELGGNVRANVGYIVLFDKF